LYNDVAQEGRDYEFSIDGTTLAAGVYTTRLRMNGEVKVMRLVLTK
jgi:hypothetical protein